MHGDLVAVSVEVVHKRVVAVVVADKECHLNVATVRVFHLGNFVVERFIPDVNVIVKRQNNKLRGHRGSQAPWYTGAGTSAGVAVAILCITLGCKILEIRVVFFIILGVLNQT